tara:strand:- start:441 stop:2102 length:1662 start_codon:yes stop_codon:yes gene_type:complete
MAFKLKNSKGPGDQNPVTPKSSVMSGSAGYYKAAKEGTFANVPNQLDEVVIYAGNNYKKQPSYNSLSKQERKFSKGSGPIARALRQKARGETPTNFTPSSVIGGIAEGVGSVIQAPQSLAVEGVEALRGNKYSFKDAVTTGKQRTPSQTIGFEDKEGWDLGGSLNTAMDIIADPSNLVGAGAVNKLIKGGKSARKVVKKALSNISNDVPENLAKRPSVSPSADFSGVMEMGGKIEKNIIPKTPLTGNSMVDNISILFGKGKKEIEQLDPLIRELAEGAPTANSVKDQTFKNLTSTQGQQRLYNESLENLKKRDGKGLLSTKRLDKLAKKEVKEKTKKFKNVTNINNDLAKSIGKDGKINRSKALKTIYSDYDGVPIINSAAADDIAGRFALGTNLTKSKAVAAHEIQHNLQFGSATALDDEFKTLKSLPGFRRDENYFRTGGKQMQRRRIASKEPRAFGAELRENMLDRGFITNKNGTWSDVTEDSLNKAKESFSKKPAGSIIPKSGFISGTRLLDFTDPTDYKKLAKSMNKLTGAVVPVVAGAGYLNSNKKK